ncbi:MAG: cbb3-type cytochrome c oxidase N-terminal domain-containing protein [Bacteroidota bacterium]|nr:cbb3-type cytochrome c oxidase N-terminal domain-containing protein [Bacteroidota bacterium]MDP3145810.1 cbb3-type cytochrome c oxidase N-terminal domain-containing protein [Bacteroidota bacterium]
MKNFTKIKLLAFAMMFPFLGFSQNQAGQENSTYFSNALFLTLLVIIIVLAIVIVAFSSAFKNIADSNFLINKYKSKKPEDATKIGKITILVLLLSSISMMAQDNSAIQVKSTDLIGGLDPFTFYFMLFVIFVELLAMYLMFYQFNFLVKSKFDSTSDITKKAESKLMMTLTDAVAVEDEESILLDHDYDGIKELDNNLPPWWKYGFYLTIIVGVIYLINFHVLGTGDLQGKEYEKEMAQAKIDVDEFMKTSANNVDENTVKLITDASEIKSGKEIFIANCAACHGKLGEGTVGPNLTDEYWVHGGSVKDIFKTIKYGWVEKGMKSWKEDLSPIQIAQVTSFIKTLIGTNPPNAKPPLGDLYTETTANISTDSTSVLKDSLNIQVKVDSLSTKK